MEEIKMKDSGIKWIGKIPEDWDVKKIKYQYKLQTGFTPDTSITDYYDDENGYIWVSIADIGNEKFIYDSKSKISDLYVNEKHPELVKKGSLLYSFKLSVGKVAFAGRDFYTNEAIASFKNSKNVCLDYLYYASFLIEENANINIYGAKILNQDLINNSITIVPPLQEQQRIAEFLDKKCADIDEIISKTEKQIETLEQYKKSLITETVTKGLNPNVKMKDSGIKWIGQIPEDWNMKRAKYLFKERFGGAWGEDAKEDENDRICIRIADFDYPRLKVKRNIDFTKRNYDTATISKVTLKNKDLLIEKSGGGEKTPVGRVVLYDLNEKALFANFMDVLRVKDEYSAEYIKYLFCSMYAMGGTFFYVNQTTGIQNLNLSALLDNEMFPVLPKQEQQRIAEFLDKKCADIDEVLNKQKESLETLKKYKQSLIYEYVTGKKRV